MIKGILIWLMIVCGVWGFSQEALTTDVAIKGEGIYSLLRRQGVDPVKYYDDFIALNHHNLKDSMYLLQGISYFIPKMVDKPVEVSKIPVETAITIKEDIVMSYAIFGKDHAVVEKKSKRLEGAIYYLISGHGGPDPGAVAEYQGKMIAEDEYAYDITLRLAKELLSHGAMVYIIIQDPNDGIRNQRILEIDRDEVAYPNEEIPLNQLKRLKQRVDIVNKLYLQNKGKYQRLLVTHVDSRSIGKNIDVFFYHHEHSKNGKRLAESIHQTFIKKYGRYQPNRSYEGTFEDRTGLYLVKKTLPAMAYIEVGNLRNKIDQKRILDPDNRQAMAKWISEGVLLDFEAKN